MKKKDCTYNRILNRSLKELRLHIKYKNYKAAKRIIDSLETLESDLEEARAEYIIHLPNDEKRDALKGLKDYFSDQMDFAASVLDLSMGTDKGACDEANFCQEVIRRIEKFELLEIN